MVTSPEVIYLNLIAFLESTMVALGISVQNCSFLRLFYKFELIFFLIGELCPRNLLGEGKDTSVGADHSICIVRP